jgi:hypothetical protein
MVVKPTAVNPGAPPFNPSFKGGREGPDLREALKPPASLEEPGKAIQYAQMNNPKKPGGKVNERS